MLFRFLKYTSDKLASFLMLVSAIFLFYSCANIGSPSGGKYDLDPPKLVKISPEMKATNIKQLKTISMLFDENVQLDNPSENVIITPPQRTAPSFLAVNRRVKVDLRDSLIPNTTYVIDFTDALADMNEKNVLENFVVTFSTGDKIDSLEISGKVLQANNLEPVTGIYVGLHDDLSDSAFTKKAFDRISKTNSKGEFTIRGVAPNKYRLYALKDANRDYMYNSPSEEIAFMDSIIVPSFVPAIRVDTVFKADKKTIDTLVTKAYTHFMPDNIVLRSFSTPFKRQFLQKGDRPNRNTIMIYTAGQKENAKIQLLNAEKSSDFPLIEERGYSNDTTKYWITDPEVQKMDTLSLRVDYIKSDSLNIGHEQTDTLKIIYRDFKGGKSNKDKDKDKDKSPHDMNKGKDKKGKGKKEDDIKFLSVNTNASGVIDVYQLLNIEFEEPVKDFDSNKLKLYQVVDSTLTPLSFSLSADSLNPRLYTLKYKWKFGENYELQVDSAAFHSYYGLWTDKLDSKFSIKREEEYGMIFYEMTNFPKDIPAFVELLDKSDKPIRKSIVKDGGALFRFLSPGTYYARAIIDSNNNGKWDTGNYAKNLQPELVCYYSKAIDLRANFELSEDWDFNAVPLKKQKPLDITKNKPVEKKTKRQQLEEQEKKKQSKNSSTTSTSSSLTTSSSTN